MFLVAACAMACLAPCTAQAAPTETTITGHVSDHGHVVPGAKVIMKCGVLEKEGFADSHGEYWFVVPAVDCPVGATVQVMASDGIRSGTIFAVVQFVNTVNIAIANVGVPEYGVLGGIVAAVSGAGVIAFTRRRLLKQGGN